MRTVLLLAALSLPLAAQALYRPTAASLRTHPLPKWFDEAKFGIFIHWGPYAVPAFHEWYVAWMSPRAGYGFLLGAPPFTPDPGNLSDTIIQRRYTPGSVAGRARKYHLENYGPNVAYDDFLPMFKAEKFDPAAWAKLFEDAGARYVVLTAKHGDEFAMWPTKLTPRNAGDMGPKRDIVGDLAHTVRARNMKFGVYHNTTYTFYDKRYPGRDWVEYMNATIKELIDKYQPSVIWGDVTEGPIRDAQGKTLPSDYWNSKEVIAYLYNHSKDPDGVVTNDRWGLEADGSHLGDFTTPERRNLNSIQSAKWELCDSLDPFSWGYSRILPEGGYMTANQLVDYLIDVVSKNGNLLINIGPRADGTIPEIMQNVLLETGAWLKTNGEAIYASRPFTTYKEGDFRFTRKGPAVYAIALEWPEDPTFTLTTLAGAKVQSVELLGQGPVHFTQTAKGLTITVPNKRPCKFAYTFKITTN
ncbi:MAG: alpha-L-fucosidase [Acidobacteria bacterium]|nr:alpha-L-fucosidase [Acidobacteriota bacterium]